MSPLLFVHQQMSSQGDRVRIPDERQKEIS